MGAPARIGTVRMSRLTIPVACFALAAGTTACGERTEPTGPAERTAVTVVLAGKPQPADLCLFQARANGEFAAAGLDVTLLSPNSAAAPLEMLGNGKADIVETRPDQVLTERDAEAPFVSVALLTTTPIDGPVKATPAAPAPKKAEGKPGKTSKPKPAPVPAPSVLVSTEEFISSNGSVVRRLVQAAGRACAAPRARLAKGSGELAVARREASRAPQSNPPAGPPVTTPAGGKPWGWQSPSDWLELVASMRKSGKIAARGAPNTAWTNEFLAGQGT